MAFAYKDNISSSPEHVEENNLNYLGYTKIEDEL